MSRNLTDRWIADHPAAFDAIVRDSLAARRPASGIAAQMAAIAAYDTSAVTHTLTQPSLVMHGDSDRVIPLECGQRLAAALPNR